MTFTEILEKISEATGISVNMLQNEKYRNIIEAILAMVAQENGAEDICATVMTKIRKDASEARKRKKEADAMMRSVETQKRYLENQSISFERKRREIEEKEEEICKLSTEEQRDRLRQAYNFTELAGKPINSNEKQRYITALGLILSGGKAKEEQDNEDG